MKNKINILYIEDDPDSRTIIKLILEKNNFNLIEANNGFKGLEILKNKKIDLILIDINMPDMNGFEIATKIKSIESYTKIPLIALTANIIDKTKNIALIAGCDGFLKKPIEPANFVTKINEFLNGKKETVSPEKIIGSMREYNVQLLTHLESQIKELNIANEDLKELDKLKSDFISIASHELKTPLVTILGFINLLLNNKFGKLTDMQNNILTIIDKDAKKLDKIVKDMITVSMLEDETFALIYELNVDIDQLTKNVIKELEPALKEREISINLLFNKNIPLIECDSTKLMQAFRNIINNSIKNTNKGSEVEIHIDYPSKKIIKINKTNFDEYIDIVIKDNGISITEDKLNMIFKNFFVNTEVDKHSTSEKDYLGTGIGLDLSIASGIIKNHKGFIYAENKRKKGMKMIIILPVKQRLSSG